MGKGSHDAFTWLHTTAARVRYPGTEHRLKGSSVTRCRLVVSSEYSGFLHQYFSINTSRYEPGCGVKRRLPVRTVQLPSKPHEKQAQNSRLPRLLLHIHTSWGNWSPVDAEYHGNITSRPGKMLAFPPQTPNLSSRNMMPLCCVYPLHIKAPRSKEITMTTDSFPPGEDSLGEIEP